MESVCRYSLNLAAFHDMIRAICLHRLDKREYNPNMVRAKISDEWWMEAHLKDFHLLERRDWRDWEEWCRRQFGWTREEWDVEHKRLHPELYRPLPEVIDESLGVV